jgi:hypothetical protein
MSGNEFQVNMLITVFSIITALYALVASFLVDPSLVPKGSWQLAQVYKEGADVEAHQAKGFFYACLITLVVLLVVSFSPLRAHYRAASAWHIADHVAVFLSAFSFMWSLSLPGTLYRIQLNRMDKLIEDRRQEESEAAKKALAAYSSDME